jgi:SAM-dependent methyltransferase
MKCPICLDVKFEEILWLECGNLDGSSLYDPLVILCCCGCGHIFNELSNKDREGLIRYYEDEYSLNNLNSPNTEGDLPGSSNKNSSNRYSNLFGFMQEYLKIDTSILDIGCATGGFLEYLDHRGYSDLHGIDFSFPYVNVAKQNKRLNIQLGSAEAIPYQDDSFDFVVADQVVEHLFDPNIVFTEAKRVLKHGGLFCVSVPHAMLYGDFSFFDFYWFLMREHIHHFDLEHLMMLAKNHGFTFVKSQNNFSNMTSEKTILPSLTLVFKNNGIADQTLITRSFNLKDKMREYIDNEKHKIWQKKEVIDKIKRSGMPLYVFGISREFFFLYENTNLRHCNIKGLIDDTECKQRWFTVDGQEIKGRAALTDAVGFVLITATAHTNKIRNIIYNVGFKGRVIDEI